MGKQNILLTVLIILGIVALAGGIFYEAGQIFGFLPKGGNSVIGSSNAQTTNAPAGNVQKLDTTAGTGSTFIVNAYDREANNKQTPLGGNSLIEFSQSGLLPSVQTGGSQTQVAVGDQVSLQTNSTTIYCDPDTQVTDTADGGLYKMPSQNPFPITNQKVTVGLNCHTATTQAQRSTTLYDLKQGLNTQLTASLNTTRADYNISIIANENRAIRANFFNNGANSLTRLGAICTLYATNNGSYVLDYAVSTDPLQAGYNGVAWKEVSVPQGLKGVSVYMADEGNNNSVSDWKHCYAPATVPYIDLHQSQDTNVNTLIKGGTLASTNADGASVCIIGLDYGCALDGSNGATCDFYRHDINARATEVGISETVSTPRGKTVGACVGLGG